MGQIVWESAVFQMSQRILIPHSNNYFCALIKTHTNEQHIRCNNGRWYW